MLEDFVKGLCTDSSVALSSDAGICPVHGITGVAETLVTLTGALPRSLLPPLPVWRRYNNLATSPTAIGVRLMSSEQYALPVGGDQWRMQNPDQQLTVMAG